MPIERRPQDIVNREFTKIMHQGFTPPERAKLGAEMGGFTGEIGQKIAELQAKGLGRVIGIPAQKDDKRAKGAYQELMYALPLTDEQVKGPDKRYLLIIPRDTGFDQILVKPRKARVGEKQKENAKIEREFASIFSPSEEPYIFDGKWDTTAFGQPIIAFVKNRAMSYADYEPVLNGGTLGKTFEDAVAEAEKRKQRRENVVSMVQDIYNHMDSGEQDAA